MLRKPDKRNRVHIAAPRIATSDSRRVKPAPRPPKERFYNTSEYAAWRATVISRAGGRCEAIENGMRCSRRLPQRLYADHIEELRDDGAPLDPANGRCLCGQHHVVKTVAAKAARRGG